MSHWYEQIKLLYQIHQNLRDLVRQVCEFMSPLVRNRLIQGIVVDVLEEANTSEELKAIVEVLNYSVLNQSSSGRVNYEEKVFFLWITILKPITFSLNSVMIDFVSSTFFRSHSQSETFGEKNGVSFSSFWMVIKPRWCGWSEKEFGITRIQGQG